MWGGGFCSDFSRFGPISDFAFRLSPILPFGFNLKPPRLEAKRSADVRSAEGACGASLSCASGAAKRNCASQGQTCPAEQCHEQPPRVGTSLNIYLLVLLTSHPFRNRLQDLIRRSHKQNRGFCWSILSPLRSSLRLHSGRSHFLRIFGQKYH